MGKCVIFVTLYQCGMHKNTNNLIMPFGKSPTCECCHDRNWLNQQFITWLLNSHPF